MQEPGKGFLRPPTLILTADSGDVGTCDPSISAIICVTIDWSVSDAACFRHLVCTAAAVLPGLQRKHNTPAHPLVAHLETLQFSKTACGSLATIRCPPCILQVTVGRSLRSDLNQATHNLVQEGTKHISCVSVR